MLALVSKRGNSDLLTGSALLRLRLHGRRFGRARLARAVLRLMKPVALALGRDHVGVLDHAVDERRRARRVREDRRPVTEREVRRQDEALALDARSHGRGGLRFGCRRRGTDLVDHEQAPLRVVTQAESCPARSSNSCAAVTTSTACPARIAAWAMFCLIVVFPRPCGAKRTMFRDSFEERPRRCGPRRGVPPVHPGGRASTAPIEYVLALNDERVQSRRAGVGELPQLAQELGGYDAEKRSHVKGGRKTSAGL